VVLQRTASTQIMESLGGDQAWFDRFLAEHAAVFYYWVCIAFYLVSPKNAYNFMQRVEHHAADTYSECMQSLCVCVSMCVGEWLGVWMSEWVWVWVWVWVRVRVRVWVQVWVWVWVWVRVWVWVWVQVWVCGCGCWFGCGCGCGFCTPA